MDTLYDERRLVTRVLRHWSEMGLSQSMPSLERIDPWLIGDDWQSCALVRLGDPLEYSELISVGRELVPDAELLIGHVVGAAPEGTVLWQLLRRIGAAVQLQKPVTDSGMSAQFNATVLYRGVALPLAADGIHPDHVLIAANYRIVAGTP